MIRRPDTKQKEDSIPSSTQANPAHNAGSPFSVWIIDDQKHFAAAFSNYIETFTDSRCTRCFESAESALATLQHETVSPDIILLDIEMPGMNGLDAIVPLKQSTPKSRIYMVTAENSDRHKEIAKQKGADGYLVKLDITKEELLEILAVPVPRVLP
jgi:CheY-like chemotaxis protein